MTFNQVPLYLNGIPVYVQGNKVQVKKHKKKRINKKWIKRYGYRYTPTHMDDDMILLLPSSINRSYLIMNLKTYEKVKENSNLIEEFYHDFERKNNN